MPMARNTFKTDIVSARLKADMYGVNSFSTDCYRTHSDRYNVL